jgi:hypothetical protein
MPPKTQGSSITYPSSEATPYDLASKKSNIKPSRLMSSTRSLPQLFDNIRLKDDVQPSMSLTAVTFSTDPRDAQYDKASIYHQSLDGHLTILHPMGHRMPLLLTTACQSSPARTIPTYSLLLVQRQIQIPPTPLLQARHVLVLSNHKTAPPTTSHVQTYYKA